MVCSSSEQSQLITTSNIIPNCVSEIENSENTPQNTSTKGKRPKNSAKVAKMDDTEINQIENISDSDSGVFVDSKTTLSPSNGGGSKSDQKAVVKKEKQGKTSRLVKAKSSDYTATSNENETQLHNVSGLYNDHVPSTKAAVVTQNLISRPPQLLKTNNDLSPIASSTRDPNEQHMQMSQYVGVDVPLASSDGEHINQYIRSSVSNGSSTGSNSGHRAMTSSAKGGPVPGHFLTAVSSEYSLPMGNPHVGNPTVGNPSLGNPHVGIPTLGNRPMTSSTSPHLSRDHLQNVGYNHQPHLYSTQYSYPSIGKYPNSWLSGNPHSGPEVYSSMAYNTPPSGQNNPSSPINHYLDATTRPVNHFQSRDINNAYVPGFYQQQQSQPAWSVSKENMDQRIRNMNSPYAIADQQPFMEHGSVSHNVSHHRISSNEIAQFNSQHSDVTKYHGNNRSLTMNGSESGFVTNVKSSAGDHTFNIPHNTPHSVHTPTPSHHENFSDKFLDEIESLKSDTALSNSGSYENGYLNSDFPNIPDITSATECII